MKKNTLIICLIAICSIGFFSCSCTKKVYKPGDVLMLQPGPKEGIDAYIEDWAGENYPNRNWGDNDVFAAIAWTAQGSPLIVRSLLKFDLSFIRTNTSIKRATLSLYAVNSKSIGKGHSSMSGSNEFILKKITSPWNEHSVTWNTQPSVTNQNQIVLPATISDNQDYTDIDLTGLIQEMINKPSDNYGIMISLETEDYYRRLLFGSSDNPDIQKRPKLVIEF
jgi:hypothetical protein